MWVVCFVCVCVRTCTCRAPTTVRQALVYTVCVCVCLAVCVCLCVPGVYVLEENGNDPTKTACFLLRFCGCSVLLNIGVFDHADTFTYWIVRACFPPIPPLYLLGVPNCSAGPLVGTIWQCWKPCPNHPGQSAVRGRGCPGNHGDLTGHVRRSRSLSQYAQTLEVLPGPMV